MFQVGSFNYAMDKLIFRDEFTPSKEEAVNNQRAVLKINIPLPVPG